LLYCVPGLMSTLVIGAALRQKSSRPMVAGERRRIGRAVAVASSLEGFAILAAFNLIPAMQSIEFSVSLQAVIVGLHFVLLARWIQVRAYYITAGILVVLGIAGFAISDSVLHLRFVCFGGACALWLPYGLAMLGVGVRRCVQSPAGATCAQTA